MTQMATNILEVSHANVFEPTQSYVVAGWCNVVLCSRIVTTSIPDSSLSL